MKSDPGPDLSSFAYRHDVFISFRGEDTRNNFTSHLYSALNRLGFRTFKDDENLPRGEQISQALLKSIEQSRISVAVFSNDYASSTWCLDELVKILECAKRKSQIVMPIFYHVDPSDVRHQRGRYGEAFAKHEERFKYSPERVQKWRLALHEAANLSGFSFERGYKYEYELIGRIVEEIRRKIERTPLHVADYPVGLESRLQKLNWLLDVGSDCDVKMVGIYGIGGIGKTTLARAVYNVISHQFEVSSFVPDVRENSVTHALVRLQEGLISDIVGNKNIKSGDVDQGISTVKSRLSRKKALVVLDDVDNLEQLGAIAGRREWFGSGSRVIITTRDAHLLRIYGVDRLYEVSGLNHQEALELFSWSAFKTNVVDPSYAEVSNRALLHAQGVPLALKALGSSLHGKTIDEWESALDKCERFSAERVRVQRTLRLSFEDLGEVEKTVFLHIACFFKGCRFKYVANILQPTLGLCPDSVIGVLVDKALVQIECGVVCMHDLIREMGREIARQESQSGRFSCVRLRSHKDVPHVLTENTETDNIRGRSSMNFNTMRNIRHLPDLKGFPDALKFLDLRGHLSSFSPDLYLGKDVMLHLGGIVDKPLKCKYLDMGAFETPNMHQQNNLGSAAQNTPKRCKPMFEDRGKYSTVYSDAGVKRDIEWLSLLSSLQPLEGVNIISNPNVSKRTCDISSEKDVVPNEFCKIRRRIALGKGKPTSTSLGKHGAEVCVHSEQTPVEKIHIQVPESIVNLGFVMEEADGDLISLKQYRGQVGSSLSDSSLKATYASLVSEATALSLLIDSETNTESESLNTKLSEETKKVLQILRDCVSRSFSFLLHPARSRFMKIIFDYILSLSADDGISLRMRSVILQLSRSFTQWSRDYDAAGVELALTTADLSKVDKLEVEIEANVKELKEVDLLEDELCSQLALLQERKRELEEHIHGITEEIREFGLPGGTVSE